MARELRTNQKWVVVEALSEERGNGNRKERITVSEHKHKSERLKFRDRTFYLFISPDCTNVDSFEKSQIIHHLTADYLALFTLHDHQIPS